MGTRADFYIGEGAEAKWLGSVAWDGYAWEKPDTFLRSAKTEDEFIAAVKRISKERDDFRSPDRGWPWPWDDSQTTDYAYCFTPEDVKVFVFGRPHVPGQEDEEDKLPKASFPNMKAIANVTDCGFIITGIPR